MTETCPAARGGEHTLAGGKCVKCGRRVSGTEPYAVPSTKDYHMGTGDGDMPAADKDGGPTQASAIHIPRRSIRTVDSFEQEYLLDGGEGGERSVPVGVLRQLCAAQRQVANYALQRDADVRRIADELRQCRLDLQTAEETIALRDATVTSQAKDVSALIDEVNTGKQDLQALQQQLDAQASKINGSAASGESASLGARSAAAVKASFTEGSVGWNVDARQAPLCPEFEEGYKLLRGQLRDLTAESFRRMLDVPQTGGPFTGCRPSLDRINGAFDRFGLDFETPERQLTYNDFQRIVLYLKYH